MIVYGILNYAVFYTILYLLIKPGYWIFSHKWGQILGGSISLFVFIFILYKYISDDDIDIDMGDDMLAGAEPEADGAEQVDANVDSDIFVPPNAGADQISMCLKKNPQNVGLHVAGGEFTRALELLKK